MYTDYIAILNKSKEKNDQISHFFLNFRQNFTQNLKKPSIHVIYMVILTTFRMYCLINARYKTSSTIITTNRKLVELPMIWGKDYTTGQAVVDRIMGNTKLIKMTGKSYRLNGLQMIELNMNNS